MGVQADVKAAIEGGRDDLIRVLAEHRLLPAAVERSGEAGSSLLGKRKAPTVRLERDGEAGVVDRQTTVRVVDALGLDSASACEQVEAEIRDHPAWNGS